MPRALRAFVPYVSCVSRVLRALVPHVSRAIRALVLHVPLALRVLVPHAICALVPHMLCATRASCSMWPHTSRFTSPFSLRTLLSRTLRPNISMLHAPIFLFICYL